MSSAQVRPHFTVEHVVTLESSGFRRRNGWSYLFAGVWDLQYCPLGPSTPMFSLYYNTKRIYGPTRSLEEVLEWWRFREHGSS